VSAALTVLALGLLLALPSAAAPPLRAGAAGVALAPPEGVPLAGYGERGPRNRSRGALAPVEARALVVERADGARVGLVALDVLIVWPTLRAAVVERVADLRLEVLLVAATHTHSGPGGYVDQWLGELGILGRYREDALEALADGAAAALRAAARVLEPARLGSGALEAPELVRNRRGAEGAADADVPVLRVAAGDGRTLATLFALAAHPVALPPENRALAPDYPGAARARIEAEHGGVAIFLAGPLGDQNPVSPDGPLWLDDPSLPLARQVEATNRLGERLGERVAALASALPLEEAPALAWQERLWKLPPVDVRVRCVGWVLGPLLHQTARRSLSREARIATVRLGELRVLGSPFELAAGVAAELRARSPGPLLAAAHVNDWLGYLLLPGDYARGGYEACLSFHGRRTAPAFVEEASAALAALP
jgi:hypothetical protein